MVNLPDSIFQIYEEVVDDFIDDNFGVSCTLFYPPHRVRCSNCTQNPSAGGSSNVFSSGGPAPFNMNCSTCGGDGWKEVEQTEDIMLRVYYSKKDFQKIAGVNIPDGAIQVIGHQSDLPKFLRANQIQPNKDRAGFGIQKYSRTTNYYPWGFKRRRYFVAFLELEQ